MTVNVIVLQGVAVVKQPNFIIAHIKLILKVERDHFPNDKWRATLIWEMLQSVFAERERINTDLTP